MDAPGGIAAALLSGCFTALLAYLNDGTDFGLVEIYVRRLRHEGERGRAGNQTRVRIR